MKNFPRIYEWKKNITECNIIVKAVVRWFLMEQAVPINGDNIPRSDHYPPHPEISNKDFYFAVSQIFGHQKAENEARNTQKYRGQETHPIRINAR